MDISIKKTNEVVYKKTYVWLKIKAPEISWFYFNSSTKQRHKDQVSFGKNWLYET